MWRVASAGVGIGTQATRHPSARSFLGRPVSSYSWVIPSQASLHTRRALPLHTVQCALPSIREKAPSTSGISARLGQIRRHGGSHGHSHGGLSELEEETEEQQLTREGAQAADRITWIGVYTNVVMSAAKGVAGVTFHSAGLLADAVHSMSDLVSDAITLVSLKYCTRPPDQFQPYGYGKYETVGALSVSLLLVGGSLGIVNHSFDTLMLLVEPTTAPSLAALDAKLASLSIDPDVADAIKSAIPLAHGGELGAAETHHHSHSHSHHEGMVLHPAALGIAGVSVAAKEALYRTTMTIGKKINSSVLISNAWHHRSDAVTSVVAMAGIGLSLAGFPMFDPIAGILVGGIILKMGGEIGWDAIKDLCDAQLPVKIVQKLTRATEAVVEASDGEIVGVRQLRSRKIGRCVHVDLTLVMRDGDDVVSFQRACEWKQRVKDAIQHDVPRVKDIIVELATSSQASSTVFDYNHHDHHQEDVQSHTHGHGHSHGQEVHGH